MTKRCPFDTLACLRIERRGKWSFDLWTLLTEALPRNLWGTKSPLQKKTNCWTQNPFVDNTHSRQKGPLLSCQDNATAAIVKLQGYCVNDFFASLQRPAWYSRCTEAHSSANTQRELRNMTGLEPSLPLKKLLVVGGTEEGTNEERFKKKNPKHFCVPRSKAAEKRKACRDGKNIKS